MADSVAARVRFWRRHRRLSQRGLAHRARLSVEAISRIERGLATPRPATLRRLAAAMGLELVDLLPLDDGEPNRDGG